MSYFLVLPWRRCITTLRLSHHPVCGGILFTLFGRPSIFEHMPSSSFCFFADVEIHNVWCFMQSIKIPWKCFRRGGGGGGRPCSCVCAGRSVNVLCRWIMLHWGPCNIDKSNKASAESVIIGPHLLYPDKHRSCAHASSSSSDPVKNM